MTNETMPAEVRSNDGLGGMRHTPGPWTSFILDKPLADIPAYVERCIAASPGPEFFFVLAEDAGDGSPSDVCHVGNGPRREANARLLAAAPDLLEALLAARDHIEMGALRISHCKDAALIDAALAKALPPNPQITGTQCPVDETLGALSSMDRARCFYRHGVGSIPTGRTRQE